ncbi:MAG TPA: hypothetical protein DEA08_36755 [Planctomycetes bacterium]|nr:hypothetical protein [Planctomycetota bacterium]
MSRRGLTLVELVVVLLILVAVASVALRSTEGLVQQGRFDATQRTVRNLEDAIIGPDSLRSPSGEVLVTGFVSDVGRLPNAIGTDPATQLSELWRPEAIPAYALRQATEDSEVELGTGWRGPYLRLAPGSSRLLDGWGRALNLLQADRVTLVTAGQPVEAIFSYGQNNTRDLTPPGTYDNDLGVDLRVTATPASNRVDSSVGGTVTLDPANGDTVIVVLYVPSAGVVTAINSGPISVSTSSTTFSSLACTIGARAIRAYQGNGLTMATLGSATNRSEVKRIVVLPGGHSETLDIP